MSPQRLSGAKSDRLTGFVFAVICFLGGFIAAAVAMESQRHSAVQAAVFPSNQGPSELVVDCYGYRVYSRTSNDANSLSNEGQFVVSIPLCIWIIAGTFCGWLGWRLGSRITRRGVGRRPNSESSDADDYKEMTAATAVEFDPEFKSP